MQDFDVIIIGSGFGVQGAVVDMFPGFSFTFRQMANRLRPEHHVTS